MTSRTYRTGQDPKIGDRIKLVDASSKSWYNSSINLAKDKTHIVTDVVQSSKSTLVQVKGKNSQFKASRFDLVSSVDTIQENGPVKFIVMAADTNIVLGMCRNELTLKEKLRELLTKNPTKAYHVFQYHVTAQTKEPQVEFVDAMVSLPVGGTGLSSGTINIVSSGKGHSTLGRAADNDTFR